MGLRSCVSSCVPGHAPNSHVHKALASVWIRVPHCLTREPGQFLASVGHPLPCWSSPVAVMNELGGWGAPSFLTPTLGVLVQP